jgi:hypothetical protein
MDGKDCKSRMYSALLRQYSDSHTLLFQKLQNPLKGKKATSAKDLIRWGAGDGIQLLRSRFQSVTGGEEQYNNYLQNETDFRQIYHDVWRVFFTPSLPIRSLIQAEIDRMGLVPGEYASAHLRALYGRTTERTSVVATEWTRNALNCASKLRPGGPFLFASDHTYSANAAVGYGMSKGTKVVARKHDKQPLHLDKVWNWETLHPVEFYDTFVDLLLMGMGRCVIYNRGGFGQWALLISYNSSCFQNQKTSRYGIGVPCNWTEPAIPRMDARRSIAPLFLEPMGGPESDLLTQRLVGTIKSKESPLFAEPMGVTKADQPQPLQQVVAESKTLVLDSIGESERRVRQIPTWMA